MEQPFQTGQECISAAPPPPAAAPTSALLFQPNHQPLFLPRIIHNLPPPFIAPSCHTEPRFGHRWSLKRRQIKQTSNHNFVAH